MTKDELKDAVLYNDVETLIKKRENRINLWWGLFVLFICILFIGFYLTKAQSNDTQSVDFNTLKEQIHNSNGRP